MALVEFKRNPTVKELRNFGTAALVMLTLLAAAWHWAGSLPGRWTAALGAAGLVIFVVSRISVRRVKPVYLALMGITWPIGWTVSFVITAVFYYGVLTPIGLVMRLFGRDPLRQDMDRGRKSYWVEHRPAESASRYFRQF
jgi:hypothetical protein